MCGIAGAVDLKGTRMFPSDVLAAMTGAIAHRGPDDEHFHREPGVALGARRLSIVDLAGGRQPIPNEDETVWVAFNGELFEYQELRPKLLERGHRLATRCDTEAWVHLWEDSGERMFDEARGQFAVSLWDRKSRTLILGRDRVGICPLHYAVTPDGWLLWGSEIKAILASGMVDARPDAKGVDYFFNFFCANTSRTFFEGIHSLEPGHYLAIRDGRIDTKMYWDLDFPDAGSEIRMADPTPLIDELEDRMRTAVERRLRGDVPVVSYISGGLDSTVVLGLSSRERGHAVPSFSIGLENAGPDERAHSTESASALGSKLTMVTMTKTDILNAYPELIRAAEGPVMDSACACLMRLAREVHSQGYKVTLTGEGADEALAGYPWFKTQIIRDTIKRYLGDAPAKLIRNGILRSLKGDPAHRPDRFPMRGVRTAAQDVYDVMAQCRSHVYSGHQWDRVGGYSPYDDIALTNPNMKNWAPLNQSLYAGYKVMLAGLLLLGKGDRVANNSSVEARYPLLDDDVINFCASIAPEYKLRGRTDKWILRQVAARTLPHAIANRKKTMFRASRSEAFLSADRPAWVDQLLSPESLKKTGFFDPAKVAAEFAAQPGRLRLPRKIGMDLTLTCVVTTQLWHHIYCGGGLCDLPVWTPATPREAFRSASNVGVVSSIEPALAASA